MKKSFVVTVTSTTVFFLNEEGRFVENLRYLCESVEMAASGETKSRYQVISDILYLFGKGNLIFIGDFLKVM